MDARVKPGHDTAPVFGGGVSQIQFSNSPRASTHIQTDVIHRPHYLVGVGAAVISLPSPNTSLPSQREGAERRLALLRSLAPRRRRPRAFARHAASRRSTVASSTPGPYFRVRTRELNPALIRAVFRPPFIRTASSHRRQPFIVRADGNPGRPGPPVRVTTGARAPHLLRH